MKTVLLPKYYVTHFINEQPVGQALLPEWMDVTQDFVRVRADPEDFFLLQIAAQASADEQKHLNKVVRTSAHRTMVRLSAVGIKP